MMQIKLTKYILLYTFSQRSKVKLWHPHTCYSAKHMFPNMLHYHPIYVSVFNWSLCKIFPFQNYNTIFFTQMTEFFIQSPFLTFRFYCISVNMKEHTDHVSLSLTKSRTKENSGLLLVFRGRAGHLALISSVSGGRCLMNRYGSNGSQSSSASTPLSSTTSSATAISTSVQNSILSTHIAMTSSDKSHKWEESVCKCRKTSVHCYMGMSCNRSWKITYIFSL